MSSVFGPEYSSLYDSIYGEKDYDLECDKIEEIIKKYATITVKKILDLGCGTGNHAIRLAERGYEVTGVDRSEGMLTIAQEKSIERKNSCKFFQSDIRDFRVDKKFDTAVMMFAVLGYHLENSEVIQALKTVWSLLNPGGLFICDLWYGPAVIHQKPGERVRIFEKGNTKVIKISSGDLDSFNNWVKVRFNMWNIQGERVISEVSEEHIMRFFFYQELLLLFEFVGLKIVDIFSFLELTRQPDLDTWNVFVVGKK